ncbi:MAG: trypsin-like peptidase domain-containing protein [Acidobacteriaceae bacterium]|nr:trypsin-like peptidase domain-containing protein [Acidobacteriaceae bacterium]
MHSPKQLAQGLWTNIRNGKLTTTFTVLGALSVGVLVGSVFTGRVNGMEKQKVDSADARPLTIPSPVTLSNGFSQIVKQVGPAVVNINTESLPKTGNSHHARRGQNNGGGGDDDQQNDMQDFFNHFFGGGGDGGGGMDSGPRRALGSGFIVDPRGYIITNNHVVENADHIYVKLSNDPDNLDQGRPATVIGTDKDTDIAVIKIDSKEPLPSVKLGNSEGTQVGDWVLAIGTPFGQRNTVSAGIISAKNRSIDEGANSNGTAANQFQRFIQTDAAINPGNSGGPLVDMAGQVIGMNTAIYTQSMGSEGIGFAMPSNTIINVYNMLIGPEHKVTRGSIGISFQAAQSSAVGRMYGFANGGVLVSTVTPNGPAQKAGIQPGDVIESVDGQSIKDGDDLVAIVSVRQPGSTVKLGYLRGGKRDTVQVSIADRSKLFSDSGNGSDDDSTQGDADASQTKIGISVQELPAAQASKLKLSGGVIITTVRPGSFADEAGLSRGLIITEINRKPVTDLSSFRAIAAGLKSGDDVVFVVRNPQLQGGGSTYLGGTLP